MTPERIKHLIIDHEAELTDEEIRDGYHFCNDWDGMLLTPYDKENECCTCIKIFPALGINIERNNK